jgi:hypothetical protein
MVILTLVGVVHFIVNMAAANKIMVMRRLDYIYDGAKEGIADRKLANYK